jgi:DNA-binding PadR family transcriptional regulator
MRIAYNSAEDPLDASDHIPLKPLQHLTLLLLAQRASYGVQLLERLEERSGGAIRLNAGSLYRLLSQLVDDRLVAPVEEVPSPTGVGAPRKVYELTALGRGVLRAETERQAALLDMARSLNLLEDEA